MQRIEISGKGSRVDALISDVGGPHRRSKGSAETADGTIVDGNELKVFLTFLDWQISRLGQLRDFIEETNSVEFEAEELRRSLPLDAIDKLVRYETHLARQLYGAIAELEQL